MNLQLRIFGTLSLILLTAVFAFAQKPQPAPTDKLPLHERIEFPEVEGWELGEKSPLPAGDDGIFINYDSPGRERVTIYVYRRGSGDVPDKLSGLVKEEFDGAREAIKTVADAGMYTDLKESKSDTAAIGATGKVKALHVQMTFKARGAPLNSEIYVFPYKGYIVKIRATRPAAVDKTRDESYARLLAAIDELFSK